MQQTPDTLIRKLDQLLDREREILLAGDLGALEALLSEKEAVIAALNDVEFENGDRVEDTSRKALRNQALLQEALAGIREVARKLGEMRRTRKTFDTYDKQGQRNRISGEAESSVEKRA